MNLVALSGQGLAEGCKRVGHSQDEGLLLSLPLHPHLLHLNPAITQASMDLQTVHPPPRHISAALQGAPRKPHYLVPMPWPLVPTRAKRDRKPSGVNHCRREMRKQLSPGQPAPAPHSTSASNPTGSFGGSKEWAESQGKLWPNRGSHHTPGLFWRQLNSPC